MILIIDNHDSFTYNLVQYVGKFSNNILIVKNDQMRIDEIDFDNISHIIISPGPGRPEDTKLALNVIDHARDNKIPLLGICLGHQAIAYKYDTKIIHARNVMHGKVSVISPQGESTILNNINKPFKATRYHSLVLSSKSLSNKFNITSFSDDGEIMSIEHKDLPLYGVQFHPESIKTDYGYKIIENFLNTCIVQYD